MTTPQALAAEGMHQAEIHADARVVAVIDAVIEGAIESGQPFSANTIRDLFPTTRSKGLVGGRIHSFAKRRPQRIKKVGSVPSNLESTHNKEIAVWRAVRGVAS